MRLAQILMLATMLVLACQKSPTNETPPEPPVATGAYVGWGRPGGTAQNVLLTIAGIDSSGWFGTITYGGGLTNLSVSYVSPGEDTALFSYDRGAHYELQGLISNVSLGLTVLEPSGQPAYWLNRELDGYNLSGEWNGKMYSEFAQDEDDVTLFVDQQGALFSGDVAAEYAFYTLQAELTSGAADGNGFQLRGVTAGDIPGYDVRFDGRYSDADSVSGSWELYGDDAFDSGTFKFRRRF